MRRSLVGLLIAFGAGGAALGLIACATISAASLDPAVEAAVPQSADAPVESAAEVVRDSSVADVGSKADGAPVVLKRISGHVDYNGPVANADVTLLSPSSMTTTSDATGDFFFYVPIGSTAIIKVVAPNVYPMIRGVVAADTNRIRNFYLAGPPEQQAAQSLGKQFDVAKGIVEVDFRNVSVGGYSVALTASAGGAPVAPGFGMVLDAQGAPQLSTVTLAGGDGSTLLLGDVAPTAVSFTPKLPDAGVLPCKPCDAPALPVQAGVVTWFDFECGMAMDCQ